MAEESTVEHSEIPWYSKVFMCISNRNRINPEKVELDDCDFFIVEPRRTLRILRPIQSGDEFYELKDDRPESINENFITRWTRRPHSLNKCRCSFRQSSIRLSPERKIISAEINRIRRSLREADKTGQNIDELEKKISVNLNCFNDPLTTNVGRSQDDSNDIDHMNKNKIVKELENYIDILLKEVLNDTMKFISNADNTLDKSRKTLDKKTENKLNDNDNISLKSPLDISFAFLPDYQSDKHDIEEEEEEEKTANTSEHQVYVNEAFIGTVHDPDCLDFDLRRPLDDDKHIDKVDCVDSGINSVETMEFPLDSGVSLEQSLMEIIDAKFGPARLSHGWDNLETQNNIVNKDDENISKIIEIKETNDEIKENEDINLITSLSRDNMECEEKIANEVMDIDLKNIEKLDTPIIENQFDKLRLGLKNDSKTSTMNDESVKKINSVTVLCGKLTLKLSKKNNNTCEKSRRCKKNIKSKLDRQKKRKNKGAEMKDYRATWKGCRNSNSSPCDKELSSSPVVFRRNQKPIIVFLHGFGSSAEVFGHQLQYFSSLGYPCIAPELLGHGMSSAPNRLQDYHFNKLLNDIEAVLHHYAFKPGRKCVLVAHNYGCSFATALGCKYQNEIRQLVLISGGGPTPLAPPTTESMMQACFRVILSPLLVCGVRRNILYSGRGQQHPYCGPEPDNQWPSQMKYVLNGMIWPDGDYTFHRKITTPTLLIYGLRDNKVSLVQECQMERTVLKAFLEAIPTAGHSPMTDAPEQVNHMIHCFIDLWKKKN
ncbi:hypothetical protein PV328_010653 [Microctonus aethiopoides]|uniref:acylglycerol lipase n=2 Tax=Microctonus aethiopoides TaxID=144406 RepID=A0AA39FI65_9HYME|nr:hypothetical protein PV328_010653 [Microctonus aethiopoides]